MEFGFRFGRIQPFVSGNCVLAAGKYLISEEMGGKGFEVVKVILEAVAGAIRGPGSGSVDTRRLALVVVRTVSRLHFEVRSFIFFYIFFERDMVPDAQWRGMGKIGFSRGGGGRGKDM